MVNRPSARTPHFALHCIALPQVQVSPPSLITDSRSHAPALPLFPVNGLWIGAVVPKRWAKRAVTRNMIKRQVLQLQLPQVLCHSSMALVVRLRTGFDVKQFKSASSQALKAQVRTELLQLLASLPSQMAARATQHMTPVEAKALGTGLAT